MVGATDLEKARMQIRWLKRDMRQICSTVWWTSERLQQAQDNIPSYFIKTYGLTEEAVGESYFLGRQAGRLDLAKAILERLGDEEND
jgi:hypothetical protein